MPNTILFLDTWTKGSRVFSRLVPPLSALGFRVLLIHFGSWGHDKSRPLEEYIDGLHVRDILFYGKMPIVEILQKENPRLVVFLSVRGLIQMAVLQFLEILEIPTCHLYHGVASVAIASTVKSYNLPLLNLLNLYRTRGQKNLLKLLPFYLKSSWITGSFLSSLRSAFELVLFKSNVLNGNIFIKGTKTALGCVYTNADINHMHLNYNIPLNQIFAVGSPDLAAHDVTDIDILSCASPRRCPNNIVYIDTALVPSGYVFSSYDDYFSYLHCLRADLLRQGYNLILKMHPANSSSLFFDRLSRNGFCLCAESAFKETLISSVAVLSEPSSLALVPALLGLPLLLVQSGKLSSQLYGDVLTSYPLSFLISDFCAIKDLLESLNYATLSMPLAAWAHENAGPLPASLMSERVASAIFNHLQI